LVDDLFMFLNRLPHPHQPLSGGPAAAADHEVEERSP
jgi:hypothetical protein